MDYGKKIAHLRKTQGMTQEELGKVLNVTYQAVSKWERGESLPDFETMSQMAKFFQVPLGYFADESEDFAEAAATSAPAEQVITANDLIIGMCTECGKMLKEDEAETTSPKIICKPCAERLKQENLQKQKETEERLEQERIIKDAKRERQRQIALGKKVDLKLVLSTLAALACFALLFFLSYRFHTDEEGMISLWAPLLFFVPICVFGAICAATDFFEDLRDGLHLKNHGYDEEDGYRRNLSLIVAAIFSAINIALYLTLYIIFKDYKYLVLMAAGTVLSFTFISQYMWGGIVQKIFTAGGFTFSLPGFIFSLDIDSILFMIIVKVILGFIAVIVFVVTTAIIACVAIIVSVVTFIPSVIKKTVDDKNA